MSNGLPDVPHLTEIARLDRELAKATAELERLRPVVDAARAMTRHYRPCDDVACPRHGCQLARAVRKADVS